MFNPYGQHLRVYEKRIVEWPLYNKFVGELNKVYEKCHLEKYTGNYWESFNKYMEFMEDLFRS